MKDIKIGLVGQRALNYLPAFQSLPGVEVTSLCDINESILAEKAKEYCIPSKFRLFEDLCASDVDAVVLSSPVQLHMQQAVSALAADKHVLSEVIAGASMQELYWLKDAVENSGKVYMMCENFCYRPDVVLVKSLIDKGYFGELYYADTCFIEEWRTKSANNWRRHWFMGWRGPFYPTHSIGPVMKWFEGDHITEVSCFGAGQHYEAFYRQESTTTTVIRTARGRLITMRHDVMSPVPAQCTEYTLQGTKGAAEIGRGTAHVKERDLVFFTPDVNKPARAWEDEWDDLWNYKEHLPANYQSMPPVAVKSAEKGLFGCYGGDYYVIEDFVAAVRGEKPSPVNVYEACEWTAVTYLAEISLQNNSRPVEMPDFTQPYRELR